MEYVTVQVTANSQQGMVAVNETSYVTVPRCSYVDLKATPKQGWIFLYWRIGGVVQPQLGANASYKAESDAILEAVFGKPTLYVQATAYDTMNPYENHKYYGAATISQAISCSVTATCWLQVGGQTFSYTVTIPAGETESPYKLVYESIPDPDIRDYGCLSVGINECDGYTIVAWPGHY